MLHLSEGVYLGTNRSINRPHKHITLTETEYNGPVFQGWHTHENPHISLFLKGGTVEKRESGTTEILPGRLRFYHSDEAHQNTKTRFPSRNLNLELNVSFLQKHGINESQVSRIIEQDNDAHIIMLRIQRECYITDDLSGDSIEMVVANWINSASRMNHVNRPTWVKTVCELLNDSWDKTVTLKDLAKVANVSRITISKYFPRYFNCTLGEYVRKLRIRHALNCILTTNFTFSQIAYECGFADQSHFTRVFKLQTGFSPIQYRKLLDPLR